MFDFTLDTTLSILRADPVRIIPTDLVLPQGELTKGKKKKTSGGVQQFLGGGEGGGALSPSFW